MTRTRLTVVVVVCVAAVLTAVSVLTDLPGRLAGDAAASEGWRDWNPSTWARGTDEFDNPVVDGLWNQERMRSATSADQPVAQDIGVDERGLSDPEPAPVAAEPVPQSYQKNAPIIGKLFFDTPAGPSVCSATVVADPARPGASDLVWTAGHCVHAGAEGGWFRNVVFVPSYNDEGTKTATGQDGSAVAAAPFGTWWADGAETSEQWIAQGTPEGGDGAAFDFAVMHVKRKGGDSSVSLEETVGAAARVNFRAPVTQDISTIGIWGYPAAPPFDGELMYNCRARPGRLSIAPDQPSLYRVGCTMTGGSSGGGWFSEDADGEPVLISNTSIGPTTSTWLAGPRLGPEARRIYESVSGEFD
ncbi:trypsin-like serine peptidase [Streptomyces sp. NPDC087844]|uniref:trypsin-like serine peptidase n=1 Tax=Streptomyces sp. NPDC087844 TaxID=3365805 RepID=UPI00381182CC